MAVDASGAIFAPIFKGQTSADPEELIDLAIAGAEYHPEYLASHGGAWSDPFTGTQVGMTEGGDWTGVTSLWTAEPGAGGPPGMFTEEGARIGDPFADPRISTDAAGMDRAELEDRAKALSLASTFQPDRQAVANQYDITDEDIAGMGEHVRALGLSQGLTGDPQTGGTFNMETGPGDTGAPAGGSLRTIHSTTAPFSPADMADALAAMAGYDWGPGLGQIGQQAGDLLESGDFPADLPDMGGATYVDVPAGGSTEGLAELVRAAAPSPGMSPYEVLAQTIELAATFGDLPGGEGNLTVNEVNGWINAIQRAKVVGNDWGVVEEIRSNVLQHRVTPARVAETYGITVEEAEMLTGPGGDIKAFLDSGKTEIRNRDTGAVVTVGGSDGAPPLDERNASEILRDTLSAYGLEGLLDDPNLDLINLWIATGDDNAVWARVRQSEPYKMRFPGMADLSAAGRAISEAEYVELERSYAQTLQAYDMPERFYDDPSDFGALIGGDVSTTEFTQRVATAFEVMEQTTSEVRQALSDYYGITDSDLAAYYLDPEKATSIFEEREKLGAARIGGIAVETGFGSVSQQTAERLRASGVTEAAARRGFQAIAPSTLAEETASEQLNIDPATGRPGVVTARMDGQVGTFAADRGGDITRGELVGAEFGTDPQAARRIEARRQRRLAHFSQKGGPAMTRGGYTGLGTAQ